MLENYISYFQGHRVNIHLFIDLFNKIYWAPMLWEALFLTVGYGSQKRQQLTMATFWWEESTKRTDKGTSTFKTEDCAEEK